MDKREKEIRIKKGICGHCKDCKYWDTENIECKNDVIWLSKPKGVYFKINDLKTQDWFGCVLFEKREPH